MLGAVALEELAATLRASRGLAAKRDIAPVAARLGLSADSAVPVGDDCAAIPDGDGFLLLAIEGFMNEFVAGDPVVRRLVRRHGQHLRYRRHGRPADRGGRCGLGGERRTRRSRCWPGMREASEAFGVPIVGGHTNTRTDRGQLSVAILGRAKRLLTSFDARPGDRLVAAIDLRGRYREPFSNWEAATDAPAERLRADLGVLPAIAESGLALRREGHLAGRAHRHGDDARGMLRRGRHDRRRGRSEAGGRAARTMAADLSELRLSAGCFARERSRGGRRAFASAASPRRTSARSRRIAAS